jgi:polyhydroxyalkanoate synthase
MQVLYVVVALLVVLVAGDFLFKKRYSVPEYFDEVHSAETEDGVEISLYRHKPEEDTERKDTPVLLAHGISVGHRNMNFDDKNGVAQYLSERGYDCWCFDLRGRGGSEVPDSPWCFDDYVRYDTPAAVDYILNETGAEDLHWVGHSMGGMLFYAVAGAEGYDEEVRSAVTLGSPVSFYNQPFLYFISLVGLSLSPLLSRIKRTHLLPYTARLTSLFVAVYPSFLVSWLFNRQNVENATVRKASTCVVARICPNILVDFADWIVNERWTSRDNEVDYHEATRSIETPTLVVSGTEDRLCPSRGVKPAYRMVEGESEYLLLEGKETENGYGHADYVFGKNAREEVFPYIEEWLRLNERR